MLTTKIENRKKVGLALGSGGVRGLAHIGVIKTLIKHGIPIDYISGSSIGSWVGAHFALFQDIEKTADFTAGKKTEKLISFLEPTMFGGLVKGDKLETMLDEWLKGASFSDLKIPMKMAATDLISGNRVTFSTGKLAKAAHGSMAVPGFFKPVVVDKLAVIDGGLSNPVPVDLVKELGAEVVIAVNLDYFSGFPGVLPDEVGFADVADGTVEIMRHHLAQYSCRGANFIIQPPLKAYSSWKDYFLNNKEGEIIRLAEKETEKIITGLKKQIFDKV